MDDLCLRRAAGFSTELLLAPRHWTVDVASHYLVHSTPERKSGGDAECVDGTRGARDMSTAAPVKQTFLPPGASSNTARFECMGGAEVSATTLYVTELFLPRTRDTESEWSADRVQQCLGEVQHHESASLQTRQDAAIASSTLACRTWVVEVTDSNKQSSSAPLDSDTSTPPSSTSIYAAVRPFFRLFVEVVLTGHHSLTDPSLDDAVQRILVELQQQYHAPMLALPAFRCFAHTTVEAEEATSRAVEGGGALRVSSDTAKVLAQPAVTHPLREPCAPSILVDMAPSVHTSSLWLTSFYSASGAAFLQFLLPCTTANSSASQELLSGCTTRWYVDAESHLLTQEPGNKANTRETEQESLHLRDEDAAIAKRLRRLLKHLLHLHWEGLVGSTAVSVPLSSAAGNKGKQSVTAMVMAAATLPLDEIATPSSLYSFASVEQAWVAHVTQCLKKQQKSAHKHKSSAGHAVEKWVLQRVSSTPPLTATFLEGAIDTAEQQDASLEHPHLTAAERAMRYVACSNGPPLVPPRCSTYVLRLFYRLTDDTVTSESAGNDHGAEVLREEVYVLQLHAPRVQSRHAIVACMASPSSREDRETTYAVASASAGGDVPRSDSCQTASPPMQAAEEVRRWAVVLSGTYRIAPYIPSLWLPRSIRAAGGAHGHGSGAGVCVRSGRLLLHVPSEDARYAGVRLAPVAAKSFTSLGSIAAWVDRCSSAASTASSPAVSPVLPSEDAIDTDHIYKGGHAAPISSSAAKHCSFALAQVGAVWTLVGDGRSASAYLEDALMEYVYDTHSKTLLNVGQPSQHSRKPGVLVIRKQPSRKVKTVSASGQPTVASLFGSQEVCCAWVDVGSTLRLFLAARDVGVGEVLVVEASLVGPHTEEAQTEKGKQKEPSVAGVSAPTSLSAGVTAEGSRAEERALEAWVDEITASAVPKSLC